MQKKIIILLLILGCKKELDITQFADDFSFYDQELRIEAIILSNDSSAIVRIDKTFLITDSELYDCIDDDGDWRC